MSVKHISIDKSLVASKQTHLVCQSMLLVPLSVKEPLIITVYCLSPGYQQIIAADFFCNNYIQTTSIHTV